MFIDSRRKPFPEWSNIEWLQCNQAKNLGPRIKFADVSSGPVDTSNWVM